VHVWHSHAMQLQYLFRLILGLVIETKKIALSMQITGVGDADAALVLPDVKLFCDSAVSWHNKLQSSWG